MKVSEIRSTLHKLRPGDIVEVHDTSRNVATYTVTRCSGSKALEVYLVGTRGAKRVLVDAIGIVWCRREDRNGSTHRRVIELRHHPALDPQVDGYLDEIAMIECEPRPPWRPWSGPSARLPDIPLTGPRSPVDHPSHYGGDTTYETIKVIEAWGLGFHLGNAVKYISRAGRKDPDAEIEDLEKARWYLDRKINQLREK